jgi:HK97 family phage prohead protease
MRGHRGIVETPARQEHPRQAARSITFAAGAAPMNRRAPTPREKLFRLVTVEPAAAAESATGERTLDVVASDETVDRYGDVITAEGWQLEAFRKNPVALFSHDYAAPIGTVEPVAVTGKQLLGRIRFAAAGVSARIDELWRLVQAGILRAVSVGFQVASEDDYEAMFDDSGRVTGFRFLRQELLELSLVTVPANPNALAIAKSLGIANPRAYFQPEEPTMEPTEAPAGALRPLVRQPSRLSDALPEDIAQQIERVGRCAFEFQGSLRTLARNTLGETIPVSPSLIGPTTVTLVSAPWPSPLLIELLPRVPASGASITQNVLSYKPDTSTGDKAALVAEGATKPESDLQAVSSVLPYHVFAHHVGVTRIALADLPSLRQLIDTILSRGLLSKVDAAIYTTLAAAATPFSPGAGSSAIDNAAIAAATLAALGGTGVTVALNPLDLAASDIEKATGSGVYIGRPPVNGQVVGCPTIPPGKLFAFANEAAYVAEREAVNVIAGVANDDFVKNIVRLLAEWRGAGVLQLPSLLLSGNAAGTMTQQASAHSARAR